MTDNQIYEQQVAPHVLGFVRGALRFGGCKESIRDAAKMEFPYLDDEEIDILLHGGLNYVKQVH